MTQSVALSRAENKAVNRMNESFSHVFPSNASSAPNYRPEIQFLDGTHLNGLIAKHLFRCVRNVALEVWIFQLGLRLTDAS